MQHGNDAISSVIRRHSGIRAPLLWGERNSRSRRLALNAHHRFLPFTDKQRYARMITLRTHDAMQGQLFGKTRKTAALPSLVRSVAERPLYVEIVSPLKATSRDARGVFCPSVVDERRSRVGHLPGALRHFAHDRISLPQRRLALRYVVTDAPQGLHHGRLLVPRQTDEFPALV
jgi:hypothetical protein